MKLAVVLCLSLIVSALGQSCTLNDNTDYDNGYLAQLYNVTSAQTCCSACGSFAECEYFSWVKLPSAGAYYQRCYIKTSGTNMKTNAATTAGPVNRNPPPPPPQCAMVEDNTDYNNGWLSLLENVPDASTCCYECSNYPGCKYWSYTKDPSAGAWYQRCFFKASNSGKITNTGTTAGQANPIAGGTPRSSKRGIAWFNTNACSDLKVMSKVSWLYNWSPLPDFNIVPCLNSLGIEFVPMQWGGGGIIPDLNFTIFGASKHLLAFNEPNFVTQSNITPKQAATMWPTIEAIAKQRGMLIGSPAASACGPDLQTDCYAASWNPQPWFDQFFANCTGCQVDFLATHIYTCNISQLEEYIGGLKKYNKPIWLSEFACPAAGQPIDFEITFMKQALQYLDNEPAIQRYAWFGTRLDPNDNWLGPQVDLLAQTSSSLTTLGQLYNS